MVAIYGLVAPLEGVLAYAPGLTSIVELERRSGLLVSDLLALGIRPGDVSALAQCPLEAFADLPTAIGWLYLYERFRLKHSVLCAVVADSLPDARCASEYLCADQLSISRPISRHWERFTSVLEVYAEDDIARRRIRDAAQSAFMTAGDWLGHERGSAATVRRGQRPRQTRLSTDQP